MEMTTKEIADSGKQPHPTAHRDYPMTQTPLPFPGFLSPAFAELRVHAYTNGNIRGRTPDGRPWSYWNLDCKDDGAFLGVYRLGDLTWSV